MPKPIDSAPSLPFATALAVDMALIAVFALQHSGMARRGFKQWLTRHVPHGAERGVYVLASSLALAILMWQWQPLGGVIWTLVNHRAYVLVLGLYVASWCFLLYSTFLIDHLDLFGLRQAWYFREGRQYSEPAFATPSLYRVVRHPIYLGWMGVVWITPVMTATHFVLAVATTLYIIAGVQLEERDLEARLPEYRQYRAKVPALIPSLRRYLRSRRGTGGALTGDSSGR